MTPANFNFATVMNIKVYPSGTTYAAILADTAGAIVEATIDSLRISNISTEGPTKSYKGGLYADTMLRHGKTMRIEMEDAIMRAEVLTLLFGVDIENDVASVTDLFPTEVVLYGETFVINEDDGKKKWVNLYMPHFIPDGLLNLTMESEGDFSVLAMSGELYPDECGNFIAIVDGTDPCGA